MKITLTSEQLTALRRALPLWCNAHAYGCLLDSNSVPSACNFDTYEFIAGVAGMDAEIIRNLNNLDKNNWRLGYVTYEYNHAMHGIEPVKNSRSGFEGCFFFTPQILIFQKRNSIEIEIVGADSAIIEEILTVLADSESNSVSNLNASVSREEYIGHVEAIKEQIVEGTFYELNYCMEFSGTPCTINAPVIFQQLTKLSPTPFASYFKEENKHLLCASPERFLKKAGQQIIAQPIKGTIKRGLTATEDEALKHQLKESEKERAENIMIVDLMRNDLARVAKTGSVKVEELFGVYTFATVHQLISTVSAQLREAVTLPEIFSNTFPMGSMTGAPKREVMHFIDSMEPEARGIFSGCVGYISPENDFDFNVVIRSVVYNEAKKFLSFHVGSAITFDAVAADEYDECMLKSQTMFKALDI